MQTDKNDMKVEKSVSMHLHAFERPCKRQTVTDTKSRKASHISTAYFEIIFQQKENYHQNTLLLSPLSNKSCNLFS